MISEAPKLDMMTTSGIDAIKALLKYQYDVDVSMAEVTVVKTNVTVGLHGVNQRREGLVKLTGKPGSGYYGTTTVQYRLLDTETAGLADTVFVLGIATTPIKLGDIVDQMLDKYGIKLDVSDFGVLPTDVMAPDYGDYTLESADTSFVWTGPWNFKFTPVNGEDLNALLPPSNNAGMDDIGEVNPPV